LHERIFESAKTHKYEFINCSFAKKIIRPFIYEQYVILCYQENIVCNIINMGDLFGMNDLLNRGSLHRP